MKNNLKIILKFCSKEQRDINLLPIIKYELRGLSKQDYLSKEEKNSFIQTS
jgi:hypothetical protein